ncbi:MAG: primosomal protein N' [Campylobacterales bacterium]|nr:primosomal protein N' [Campylobacterales bacterium]
MHYYEVALLRSSAPTLTYHSAIPLSMGTLVDVPVHSTVKQAVVLKAVEKPIKFETAEIVSSSDRWYTPAQIAIAQFMAEYYFSSLGEAIGLFVPHCRVRFPTHQEDIETQKGALGNAPYKLPTLSAEQQNAYHQLLESNKSLLFGVTGSGKTEIFITLMAKMIEEGKRSIFLMPEISLTRQMQKRLEKHFGKRVIMWHSKLTKKQKEKRLEAIYAGEVDIVAGARSALFTPLEKVGLIIVDEEHDDSYKSMMKPRYHARDMAVYMREKLGAKVVLASATPSLTSYAKYSVVRLPKPFVETKKTYHFVEGTSLSNLMIQKIKSNFQAGEQSLLFLPTRGNFKYLYCSHCGKTHLCPYCSVGMALHRYARHLKCHYCNYTEAIRESCVYCGHSPLLSERMGTVEAKEIIENSVKHITIEQFDKDSITTAKKLNEALKRFETKESHLLLGTQMLSKGHDYANITLSIILGLDYILGIADYRARERAMSLLIQIAGRSGRAKSAEVIVQSANADFFKEYIGNYEAFLKDEQEFRRDLYPPFVSLARVLIAHKEDAKAAKITLDTVEKLKVFEAIEIVGHGKAPVEKIAGKFRYTILLRSSKRIPLLKALHSINSPMVEIDMDPVEFS